ncbi:MAG: right-handed parallel beta-helix repeat-containing protein [Fimbriimonas sp.]|nr:right-handed parallel beta-helix repeat-containing protein [Fimbriimonas sp.]
MSMKTDWQTFTRHGAGPLVLAVLAFSAVAMGQEPSKDPKVVFAKTQTAPTKRSDKTYVVAATTGRDSNPGTAAKPFKTIQHAVDLAIAGDTVLVKDGMYHEEAVPQQAGVQFRNSGAPDAWIRVKAYPKCRPHVTSPTWGTLRLTDVAYIEVSGFDVTTEMVQGQTDPNFQRNEGNGINIERSHHILVRNNVVHDCGGGGISTAFSDYLTVEGNDACRNSFFSIYNCSGISLWEGVDFDEAPGFHNVIRGNRSWENENKGPTPLTDHKLTDGNGIIIDGMNGKGAILIENNLCWNNGGRGIQVFHARNVLIRNNTCAWNERTPESESMGPPSDLRAVNSDDCVFDNNIVLARPKQEFRDNWQANNIRYSNNMLFGYDKVFPGIVDGNILGVDPMFKHAVLGQGMPDFRLMPKSPAIGKAIPGSFPAVDFNGKPRPKIIPADLGAIEH